MESEPFEPTADGGTPAPGQILAGTYRVDKLLAQGGMGAIVAATHLRLGQRVAIKLLLPEVASKPEYVERFLREARAAVGLEGEHVVRVYDVGQLESGRPYMVMEYLRGHDLASELERRGPLPVAEAVSYVLQACEAVAEAHRAGTVHRDLKPANLFLARQADDSRCVKVLDFGISKQLDPDPALGRGLTVTSSLLGSPHYMSPEQIRNARSVDRRADIWALGVVLYELVADTTPFPAETLSAISAMIVADPPVPLSYVRSDVPVELEAVVHRCLEKDPARRYQSVGDLVEQLHVFGPAESARSLVRVRAIAQGARGRGDSQFPPANAALSHAPTFALGGAGSYPRAHDPSAGRSPHTNGSRESETQLDPAATTRSTRARRAGYVALGALAAIGLAALVLDLRGRKAESELSPVARSSAEALAPARSVEPARANPEGSASIAIASSAAPIAAPAPAVATPGKARRAATASKRFASAKASLEAAERAASPHTEKPPSHDPLADRK